VQDLLLRGVEFLENLSLLGEPEGFKVQGLKFKVQEWVYDTLLRVCQNETICFLGTDYADYTDKL